MAEIEVHSDAYDEVRRVLSDAATKLAESRNSLSSAVPAMAFGPIGSFIPPILNQLGGAIEGAAQSTGTVSQRAADGIQQAVDQISEVDKAGRADLERIAAGS